MKFIPNRIFDIISKNSISNNKKIVFENEYFVVVEDKLHNKKSYHYTAWIKKDVRSIIEINKEIIDQIKEIINILIDRNIIQSNHYAFIHFPPNFWRLHVHIVENNHIFEAPNNEIFHIQDIINNYENDPEYYIKNIQIKNNNDNNKKNYYNSSQEWLL